MHLLRLLALSCVCSLAGAAPTKTNVVFILIDDFGYECVTANGGERPNMGSGRTFGVLNRNSPK